VNLLRFGFASLLPQATLTSVRSRELYDVAGQLHRQPIEPTALASRQDDGGDGLALAERPIQSRLRHLQQKAGFQTWQEGPGPAPLQPAGLAMLQGIPCLGQPCGRLGGLVEPFDGHPGAGSISQPLPR